MKYIITFLVSLFIFTNVKADDSFNKGDCIFPVTKVNAKGYLVYKHQIGVYSEPQGEVAWMMDKPSQMEPYLVADVDFGGSWVQLKGVPDSKYPNKLLGWVQSEDFILQKPIACF